MKKEMTYKGNKYRIKEMNMIKVLSFRSLFDFSSLESSTHLYETFLENIEVEINDKWLPVKTIGTNIYLPNGIENDAEGIDTLISFFGNYLKEVFPKSDK